MSFFTLPVVKNIIGSYDQDIKNLGLQKATKIILEKTKTKLEIKKDKNTDNILKNKPVLIVGNHPYEIEPLLIFGSSPVRKKSYIIANTQFVDVSKNLNQHIIPVYIKHHMDRENKGLSLRVKTIHLLSPTQKMTQNKAHQKNIKSIENAGKKLNQNSSVLIFPADKKGKWYPGVGFIAKNYKSKKDLYFQKIYIKGTSKFDLFRIFPIINLFFPKISITYAKPEKINHLLKYDAKKIRSILEKDYENWIEKIS